MTGTAGPDGSEGGRPGVGTLVRQGLIVLVGVILATVMVILGIWQMGRFETQRANSAQARIGQPVVVWSGTGSHAGSAASNYGRRVQVTGRFVSSTQLLVGTSYPLRVVTGLTMASGETIPVVRGVVDRGQPVPTAPSGTVTVTGVLLASEAQPDATTVPAPIKAEPALRLEVLAQTWPEPLVPGSLTLLRADAVKEGLTPAEPKVPETDGGDRNRGYALQWWAFAAFALGMSIVFARAAGRSRKG